MKFFLPTTALLACTTAGSSVLVGRSAATIVNSINQISAQLTVIYNTVSGFNGGVFGTGTALEIQSQTQDLENIIQQAASTANASPALDNADSAQVAIAVAGLQPAIYNTLNELVVKQPAFSTAILGVGSADLLVYSDLMSLKNDTDQFGAAVIAKVTQPIAQVAPLLLSDIDFHFQRAIAVFNPLS